MNWLAWIVVAVLAVAAMAWLVRRFRTEGRRIDGMMRDFDRENPRQEPGSRRTRDGSQESVGADNRRFGGRAGHRLS